jgi:hypothetical protein
MIDFKSDLYTLLKGVIGSETLIWADQNSPRPPFPYWTARVSVGRAIGEDSYGQGTNDNGDINIRGVREATVQLQRIGTDSDFHVGNFRDKLSKITVMEEFQKKDIALYDWQNVLNVPFQIDSTRYEPRATIDLFVRFATVLTDRVGFFENVEVNSTYVTLETAPAINPDLSGTISVNLG